MRKAKMRGKRADILDEAARKHFLRFVHCLGKPAVLMKRDPNGTLHTIFVSEEFGQMMECGKEEAEALMAGDGFLLTTHPEDRPDVGNMLRNRVAEDGTQSLTIRKVTARGNIVWCNVHYAFIDDFGGNYVYCTYFDVTVAHTQSERLRTAYLSIGDNFYRETEQTLGMFRVNLTNGSIEDMRGRDLFETDSGELLYPEIMRLREGNYPIPAEQELFRKTFDRVAMITGFLKGRNRISQFLFSRRRDGRFCYVKYSAVVVRHPNTGEIIAFITELEANKELVEHAMLNKILARHFDMVAYLVNGRYSVVAGDAALIEKGSIFPHSPEGDYEAYLKGQVFPVLSGEEGAKASMADALALPVIREQAAQKAPYKVNIACDIDGSVYYKRFDFYTVDPAAEFFIVLKSDTTEEHHRQVEQNNRLKEALADAKQASVAKTAFLSRMSHEIRTPMNAIIGLDNIALHEEGLSESMRTHLEKIGSSARYLLSLINDILDMSRIESGRMVLRSEEFSFRSFLDQLGMLAESQCGEKGLQFHLVVHGNLGNYYIGDDMKLKQILINILSNAVKFTEPGGDITLSVECTGQYEGQSSFRFVVRDTGIGMDKEFLPRIFDAFSQEDATTTSRYGGSGLGLAITRNIVELMNGSISVESEKGKGSAFTVTVPLRDSSRKEGGKSEDLHPKDLSVLIIDDDPLACRHAKSVMEEAGIAADTCSSGREAVEMARLRYARRQEYNIILVDLRMPEQDGVEVTRELRKVVGHAATVIILTVYDWSDVEREAVEAGVDSFIEKPLVASNLLQEVRRALRRKKLMDEEPPMAELEGRRILVVEDMMVNAEIMKQLIMMRGMEAEHAENGKIAVDMVAGHPAGYYDAVLMDIRMPVMDGLQATAAIRALEHPDSKDLPIIAVTANALDEDVQRSLQVGMNAHLAKPTDPDHLYRTLQEIIGRREAAGKM